MFSSKFSSLKNTAVTLSVAFLSIFGLALTPVPALADNCPANSGFLGFPTWYRGLQCKKSDKGDLYVNEKSIPKVVWTIALNALDILLHVAGIVAIFMILVSAFKYITNGGDQGKIASAKQSLLKAVIGLVIAILASTIVGFVTSGLTGGW